LLRANIEFQDKTRQRMSTTPPIIPPIKPEGNELTVVSHSTLFYWWPVWAFGYIAAIISFFSGDFLVIVPGPRADEKHPDGLVESRRDFEVVKKGAVPVAKTEATDGKKGRRTYEDDQIETRSGYLTTEEANKRHRHLIPWDAEKAKQDPNAPQEPPEVKLHTTRGKGIGVVWATMLLLVIFVTNVPLRGMWSVLIITVLICLSVLFWALDIWDNIFAVVSQLGIQMNMGGYVFISTGLFIMWSVAFFFFDRQMYIVFQPGLMKVCLEIGEGEKSYDTVGMTIERQRNDIFRHWILGLGSGDLIVRTTGADAHEFRLNNVLFLNWNLQKIEELQARRHSPKQ